MLCAFYHKTKPSKARVKRKAHAASVGEDGGAWGWKVVGAAARTPWVGREFALYSGAVGSHWKVSSRNAPCWDLLFL